MAKHMILNKTLNYLKEFVTNDPDNKVIDDMNIILSKLKSKAQVLEAQLENEKNMTKLKGIQLKLKVIYKQQEKGKRFIQERERDSHSPQRDKFIIKPKLSPSNL